jgi:lysine-specific demethylase 8
MSRLRSQLVLVALAAAMSLQLSEAVPNGHLEPLGGHMPPEGSVEAIDGFPTPLDFFDKYVKASKPVLMRGAAKLLKAYSLWTDEYMSEKFGKAWVEVEEGKKENRDLGMWTETFGDFLRKYQGKDAADKHKGNFYSVSAMPLEQRKEYEMPRMVNCPAFYNNRVGGMRQINHWFSSGGTASVLHKDGFENLNCLMDGSKDMVFIDKSYTEEDLHWDNADNHGHSFADCTKVDLVKYPKIQKVKWWKAHMDRGDCLFIPHGWYHHVKSHPGEAKRNYAINLWWEMDKSAQGRKAVEACPVTDVAAGPKTASELKFSREQMPIPPGQSEGGEDGEGGEDQDGPDDDDGEDGEGGEDRRDEI